MVESTHFPKSGKKKRNRKDDCENDLIPEYYFHEGFRYVKEYEHVFKAHSKKRWINKQLLSIFISEFKLFPSQYYVITIFFPL
jgi:hypothetical protein